MVEGWGFIMQNRLRSPLFPQLSSPATRELTVDGGRGGRELATSRSIGSTKRRRVLPTEDIFEESSRKLIMRRTREREREKKRGKGVEVYRGETTLAAPSRDGKLGAFEGNLADCELQITDGNRFPLV